MRFEGGEINIYTTDGESISISLNELQLTVMLKSVAFAIDNDKMFMIQDKKILKKILDGDLNPFKCKLI